MVIRILQFSSFSYLSKHLYNIIYFTDESKSVKSDPVEDLLAKSKVDISALLPPGFNSGGKPASDKNEAATEQPSVSTTASGSFKLVFPSRPGGRKPIHKITTPSSSGGNREAATPRIQKGWPSRYSYICLFVVIFLYTYIASLLSGTIY